jgi:hypothetical protein
MYISDNKIPGLELFLLGVRAKSWCGCTGTLYPYYGEERYNNHGFGGIYNFTGKPHEARGPWRDLPRDEYPYTIEYEFLYPEWVRPL